MMLGLRKKSEMDLYSIKKLGRDATKWARGKTKNEQNFGLISLRNPRLMGELIKYEVLAIIYGVLF